MLLFFFSFLFPLLLGELHANWRVDFDPFFQRSLFSYMLLFFFSFLFPLLLLLLLARWLNTSWTSSSMFMVTITIVISTHKIYAYQVKVCCDLLQSVILFYQIWSKCFCLLQNAVKCCKYLCLLQNAVKCCKSLFCSNHVLFNILEFGFCLTTSKTFVLQVGAEFLNGIKFAAKCCNIWCNISCKL